MRTPDLGGFALGAKVVHLAAAAAPAHVPRAARNILERLRGQVRGGIHLALIVDGHITIADSDPDFPFSDQLRLAREPERFALGILLSIARGESDRATHDDLDTWGVVRRLGVRDGCLAAPIRDDRDAIAGALAYSGPLRRIDPPAETAALLTSAAAELGPLLT